VKSGHTAPEDVRGLHGVVDREKAALGVLLTLQMPTAKMRAEAAAAGFYSTPGIEKRYPRVQILTIEELLAGKTIAQPPSLKVTFKQAPVAKRSGRQAETEQMSNME
jgi:hypothetical protein